MARCQGVETKSYKGVESSKFNHVSGDVFLFGDRKESFKAISFHPPLSRLVFSLVLFVNVANYQSFFFSFFFFLFVFFFFRMADGNEIKITLKCSNGKKVEPTHYTVDPEILVSKFKADIEDVVNIPKDLQMLIFAGHVLKDDRTLKSYGLLSFFFFF